MTIQQMLCSLSWKPKEEKGTITARFKSHDTKTIDPFSQKPTENAKVLTCGQKDLA